MKKIFIVAVCNFLLSNYAFSQTTINLEEIKQEVTDSTSASKYKSVIDTFNTNPLSLDSTYGPIIYYGKLFTGYDPYKINFEEIDFTKLVTARKFKQAISKGEALLNSNPANLEVLSNLLTCYSKTNNDDKEKLTKAKVNLLISSILRHGNGQSETSTLKVVSVGDEYVMMERLNITPISRSTKLTDKAAFDTWKAKNSSGKRIEFFIEVIQKPNSM